MHTCAVEQSLLPHAAPSMAGAKPQPLVASHTATWHGSLGSAHATVSWMQPVLVSHASLVHALPSLQSRA